jgi:hypothetical protein
MSSMPAATGADIMATGFLPLQEIKNITNNIIHPETAAFLFISTSHHLNVALLLIQNLG